MSYSILKLNAQNVTKIKIHVRRCVKHLQLILSLSLSLHTHGYVYMYVCMYLVPYSKNLKNSKIRGTFTKFIALLDTINLTYLETGSKSVLKHSKLIFE